MTTYNYGPLAAKAVKLIAKYGKTVTLSVPSTVPADPDKPWRGPDGSDVTRMPMGLVSTFDKNEINGDTIRTTDMKLLIAGQDPMILDISMDNVAGCVVDGIAYGATNLQPVKPGVTDMLFTLRLRQG